MKIKKYSLTGRNGEQLTTEIRFFVAASKAQNIDLIILNIAPIFEPKRESGRVERVRRFLKSFKRSGGIQLFVELCDLDSDSTEVEYLKNKYPYITEISESFPSFVVKL